MFLITVFTFHIWFSQLNTSITQSLQHSVVNNNKSESDDFTGTRLLLLIPRCSTLHFTVSNQPLETLNIFATQNVEIFFIKCGWFVYFQLVGDQHHWCVVITGHTLGSYWHHTLASHPAPSRHQQPRSALRPRQLLPMTSMLQRIISALLQHVLLCFILIDTGKENIVFTYHHQQGRLRCYLKCRCLQWFTRVTDAVELSVSLVNTNTTLPGPGVPPPHTGAAV